MPEIVLARYGEPARIEKREAVVIADLESIGAIPTTTEIVVPLALWLDGATQGALKGRKVVVLLKSSDDPLRLAGQLAAVAAVAIEFPVFSDGRGYSIAALLRERLRYGGQIRAVGDVLRDQAFYMQRCGFDAFVPRPDRSIDEFIKGFGDFRETYQASAVLEPLFRRREEALLALAGRA
jgi:uncharacterized protein (DUF934 family)